MNEMDVLASFRAEVPATEVSPRIEHRVMSALQSPERAWRAPMRTRLSPRPGHRWRLAAVGASTMAAALVTGVVVAFPPFASHTVTRPGPAATAPLTASQLAYRAASAALGRPDVSPGQWVYRQVEVNGRVMERWQTADSAGTAWYSNGSLVRVSDPVTVPFSYSRLKALPADPAALDKYLIDVAARYSTSPGARVPIAFSWIGSLFENFVLPPRLTAELYRALASLPGVAVEDNVTSAAGMHGAAFTLRQGDTTDRLILRKSDYTVIGGRLVYSDSGVGTVTKEWSLLRQALVSGPGVRP